MSRSATSEASRARREAVLAAYRRGDKVDVIATELDLAQSLVSRIAIKEGLRRRKVRADKGVPR